MELAATLRDWVYAFDLDDAAPSLVADGRLRIIDVIGLALAAEGTPLGRAVLDGALALGGAGDARALGSGAAMPAANAAMVNGTLAHAMDFDDSHLPSLVHPSAPIVAAALALGETIGASGRELLTAVVAGNEVGCRLGMAAPGAFHRKGLHPTGVLLPPAAALVAARLLDLTPRAALNAVGIACSQASGILESFQDGTWVKTLHAGWAAHAGIAAALLARAGFTGPASGLDGRFGLLRAALDGPETALDLDPVTTGLGTRWESESNFFKLYPCAHVILPFVEIALALRAEGLDASTVEQIEVEIPSRYIPVVCEPREAKIAPRTATHARASLAYAVASAFVRGTLDIDAYADTAIADRAVLALAARIAHRPLAPEPSGEGFTGAMTVTVGGARRERRELVSRRGHPRESGTPEAVKAKFAACARRAIPEIAVRDIVETVDTIEALPRVADLTALCIRH